MSAKRNQGSAPSRSSATRGSTSLSEEDVMELLPWYATGKTSPDETRAIEGALARSPRLQAELALVKREREVARKEAAAIGEPAPEIFQNLMRSIDGARQLPPLHRDPQEGTGFLAGLLRRRPGLTQAPVLRLALAAACLVVVVEGAAIYRLSATAGGGGTYQTASAPDTSAAGPHLIVTFKPQAGIGAIGGVISDLNASVIRGPMPDGGYVIGLQPGADVDQAIAVLRGHGDLIATVDRGS